MLLTAILSQLAIANTHMGPQIVILLVLLDLTVLLFFVLLIVKAINEALRNPIVAILMIGVLVVGGVFILDSPGILLL